MRLGETSRQNDACARIKAGTFVAAQGHGSVQGKMDSMTLFQQEKFYL
jgi:hypothetical protein